MVGVSMKVAGVSSSARCNPEPKLEAKDAAEIVCVVIGVCIMVPIELEVKVVIPGSILFPVKSEVAKSVSPSKRRVSV